MSRTLAPPPFTGWHHGRPGSRMLAAAAILVTSAQAQAQAPPPARSAPPDIVVRGRVADERGRPVAGVELTVPMLPAVHTDTGGRFVLSLPEGRLPVMLAVRQMGFLPDSVRVDRNADSLRILLRAVPTTLGAVVVTAKASEQKLVDNGFYRRQRTTHGRHLDPVALRAYVGPGLAGVVRDTPRLTIRRSGNDDYAFGMLGGRPCRMNVFVDGRFDRTTMPSPVPGGGEGIGLRELMPFDFIYAVEIYPSAASVPTQFARVGPNPGVQGRGRAQIPSPVRIHGGVQSSSENQNAECGAIVIWTKEPEAAAARP